ncbi:Bromodomain-containing protein [Microstroma glucosiphilum]|uniref:Bromodomain-containing protein n=1 Tax=Pseudomicrostroma glucosiphilum TaxID=1684307 RepID=A0A316UJB5_9BASI|nr:Bromodomain-containing protein [Pseudomicrostroma glucosiphilum]PWN23295.1 Bromodomain-containing protein [Pseudomicrostroma glucosiphilum]
MAPAGPVSVAGVSAANILEGGRKRSRLEQVGESKASSSSPHPSGPTSTTTDPEEVTKLGYKLLNVVYHARDIAEEHDPTSLLVEPFLALPDAAIYPDYYQIIKRPLTFEDIRAKLAVREYASFEDVKHDCEIICMNAKRYNLRDTPFWLKAKALHSIIKDSHAELTFAAAGTKSTQLDLPASVQLLFDVQVEGVEPMTSAPPSPAKKRKQEADASETAGEEDTSMEDVASSSGTKQPSGLRRITIKKKSGSQAETSAPPRPPAVEALTAKDAVASSPGVSTGLSSAPSPIPSSPAPAPAQAPARAPVSAEEKTPPAAVLPQEAPSSSQLSQSYPPESSPGPSVVRNNGADKRRRPFGRGKNLKSQMKQWVAELIDLKRPGGGPDDYASDFFEELPSQDDYPDYYQVIQQPISLKEINENVSERLYKSPYAFFTAVQTMIANAKYYNEENSIIWQDADAIERHVNTKMLPIAFELGFTLDPNDTRSSVLPLHVIEAHEASQPGSPAQSMTPPPGQASSSRLKVKLGGRNSLPGQDYLPNGIGQQQPATLGSFASPGHIPGAGPGQSPELQSHPNGQMSPEAAAPQFSASGRPVRSAASRAPSSRDLPPPLTTQNSTPGPARSPPAPGGTNTPQAQVPQFRPGYTPHQGVTPSHSMPQQQQRPQPQSQGSYRGQPPYYTPPQRYPQQQQQQYFGQLPYAAPAPPAETVDLGKRGQIRRLSGIPPPSVFGNIASKPLMEQDGAAAPLRPAAIPSFVVLSQGLKKVINVVPAASTSAAGSSRQFVLPVGEGRSDVKVLFRLRDFGGAPQKQNTVGSERSERTEANGEAMDVDGEEVSGQANGATQPGVNGHASHSEAQQTTSTKSYNPAVSTILNGRKVNATWTRDTATVLVPLQRGPNLLEIFLVPGPPLGGAEGGDAAGVNSPCEGYRLWIVR